jgi:hypothetical protein
VTIQCRANPLDLGALNRCYTKASGSASPHIPFINGRTFQSYQQSILPAEKARSITYARVNETYKMAGHQWTARRCGARLSNGQICYGRALENGRCKWHSGKITPYHTRPISPEGIERIREASRKRILAAWAAYREAKAKGLPLPRLGRPKRQAGILEAPKPPARETVLTEQDLEFARTYMPNAFQNLSRKAGTGHITNDSDQSAKHK